MPNSEPTTPIEVAAMPIKLLVTCRHGDAAVAISDKVMRAAGGQIAGEAIHIAEALRWAAANRPDVLLLEYTPELAQTARKVLSRMSAANPSTRVLLLLSGSQSHRPIVDFIRWGAAGCLLASSEPSLLAKAVREVHLGATWFGRTELLDALRSRIVAEIAETFDVPGEQEVLTARELEILAYIGSAMTDKEIARQLKISYLTVKTHLHRIYVKLGKSGRYKAFMSDPVAGALRRRADDREFKP
jgi:DNA-binding NarL/FixJ family response regulator